MSWLDQLLQGITYMNLGENKWNILGVFWLISLCIFYYIRFKKHFTNGYLPRPAGNPHHNRKRIIAWHFVIILFAFGIVYLLQMMLDDFITTPINLVFGSWSLLTPHMGSFSFLKLIAFKWDVYCSIIIYSLFFTFFKIWRFFRFTKYSTLLLTITVVFQFILASNHVFYFLDLSGSERIFTYWVSYPWFRILTGLFCASIMKKPELITDESAADLS